MKLQEIRTIAQQHNIKTGNQSKVALIRKIQLHEGNLDCFATGIHNDCDQPACLWRNDCSVASEK